MVFLAFEFEDSVYNFCIHYGQTLQTILGLFLKTHFNKQTTKSFLTRHFYNNKNTSPVVNKSTLINLVVKN